MVVLVVVLVAEVVLVVVLVAVVVLVVVLVVVGVLVVVLVVVGGLVVVLVVDELVVVGFTLFQGTNTCLPHLGHLAYIVLLVSHILPQYGHNT